MPGKRAGREEALEAVAVAFLARAPVVAAPDRLRDHGLQLILARARAAETGKEPAAARRAYRNPALLRHAFIVAMVALLIMILSTSGVYALSLDAQPGSTLYGTKIFFERARVVFSTSSAGDVRLEMGFSERRLRELQEMAASGSGQGAERWLREYGRNIEGAGILFEGMSAQEAEDLAAEFQEMLDRQEHMLQGMRQGQQPGLSEAVEGAWHMCDQEKARMRMRCGQQDPGGSGQGPGGQGQQEPGGQGQGNCPGMEDATPQQQAPSSGSSDPMGQGTSSGEPGSSTNTTGSAPGGGTLGGTMDPPADASQPQGPAGDGGGQVSQGTGYQDEGTRHGCMP